MFEINTYADERGKSQIKDYLKELEHKNEKDSRIKYSKICLYINYLKNKGISGLTSNEVKHIEDEIWELRPLKYRILFAEYENNKYVLLHIFQKQTQKTPRREIDKAHTEFKRFMERNDINE